MKALKWIAGIFFLIGGLGMFTETIMGGLVGVLLGLFVLPPSHQLIVTKANLNLTRPIKWVIAIGLFFVMGIFINMSTEAKEQDADKLIVNAEKLIDEGKIDEAKAILKEAKAMYSSPENNATKLQSQFDNLNSDTFLKTSLASLSDNEFEALKNGSLEKSFLAHKALNTQFIEKLNSNSDKRAEFIEEAKRIEEERKQKEEQAKLAREKEERNKKLEESFSAWDGSHRNLTKVIKESMNDPDSYEHIETKYWDMGDHLVVLTTFRGKNAFGGKVKNSVKAKVALNGQVLEIIEQF